MQYQNSHFRPGIPFGRQVFMCCSRQFGGVVTQPDISGRQPHNCNDIHQSRIANSIAQVRNQVRGPESKSESNCKARNQSRQVQKQARKPGSRYIGQKVGAQAKNQANFPPMSPSQFRVSVTRQPQRQQTRIHKRRVTLQSFYRFYVFPALQP